MTPPARVLFAALIAVGVVWGITMPMSKVVVEGGYRHFGIIFWQLVVCSALLGGALIVQGRGLPVTPAALGRYVFIALFGTILPNAGSYIAQEGLPAGLVSVCFALIPMMALPLALAAGIERPSLARLMGLVAGMVGILLIVVPEASLPDRAALIFLPFALASALCYAIEATGLGKFGAGDLDPVQLLAGASLVGIPLALPPAILTGAWIWPGQGPLSLDVLMIGVAVIHTVAYTGYVWIVGHGGAVFGAQVSYLVTGSAVIWSMLLLGERYSIWVWAAIAVVFIGLFLVQPRRRGNGGENLVPHPDPAKIGADERQVS